jgi:hypothetical protein
MIYPVVGEILIFCIFQGYFLPGEEKKTLRHNIEKEWGEPWTLLKPS